MLALFGCAVPDCVTAIVSDAPAEVDTRETVRANSRAQLSDLFEDEAPPRLQRNARTGSTRRIKKKKKHALARTVKHAVEEKAAQDGAASSRWARRSGARHFESFLAALMTNGDPRALMVVSSNGGHGILSYIAEARAEIDRRGAGRRVVRGARRRAVREPHLGHRPSAKAEDRDLAVKIRKELAEFDKDGDGTIDNEELVKFIKKHADAEKKLAKERHDAELESAKQQHEAELELHRREKAERNVVRVVAGSFFLGNGTGGNGSAAALTTKGGAVLATASSDFAVGERGAMVSKADGAPLTTKSADLRTDAGVLETPGGAAVVAVAGGATMGATSAYPQLAGADQAGLAAEEAATTSRRRRLGAAGPRGRAPPVLVARAFDAVKGGVQTRGTAAHLHRTLLDLDAACEYMRPVIQHDTSRKDGLLAFERNVDGALERDFGQPDWLDDDGAYDGGKTGRSAHGYVLSTQFDGDTSEITYDVCLGLSLDSFAAMYEAHVENGIAFGRPSSFDAACGGEPGDCRSLAADEISLPCYYQPDQAVDWCIPLKMMVSCQYDIKPRMPAMSIGYMWRLQEQYNSPTSPAALSLLIRRPASSRASWRTRSRSSARTRFLTAADAVGFVTPLTVKGIKEKVGHQRRYAGYP
ncbi:hypothetical protein JL722_10775 [Aureococcus anophagefferens]|nr:hypothetical protein JL722_10775 [Aureococcus anophagefferens]